MASFEDDADVEMYGEYEEEQPETEEEQIRNYSAEVTGLKRLFHLPFDFVWKQILHIFAIFLTYRAIYGAGLLKYGEKDTLAYYFGGTRKFSAEGDFIWPLDFTVVEYLTDIMYLVDIVLIIGCKNIHGLHIPSSEICIPNWILFMEVLSIIPTEMFIPMNPLTEYKKKLYYIVQLNDVFKIVRVYYRFYNNHTTVGGSKLLLQISEYYLSMGFAIMVGFVATYNIACVYGACKDPVPVQDYLKYLYISVSKITTNGVADYPDHMWLWTLIFNVIGLLVFAGITCISLAYVTIAFLTTSHHKHSYIMRQKLTLNELKKFDVPKDIEDSCIHHFEIYWQKRSGYWDNQQYFQSLLPSTMYEEMKLDISWSALQHSQLFRNMNIAFLRQVSVHQSSQFMLPGKTLYAKNYPKNSLVYIVSGVVQILSEEDDETPILSFSGGTCLGESSLFLNCYSNATVRCKTTCNVHLIRKRDFVKIIRTYPKQYRELMEKFWKRFETVKQYRELALKIKERNNVKDRTDYLTIMWLKSTLHRLMMKDGDTSIKHQCQNIFLRDEFNERQFVDRFYTAKFLDMLAISERLQLATDSVFLKSSCPCIFQPGSIILDTWECLIILLVISVVIIVPYFAFVESSTPLLYTGYIYIITIFWMFDMYIQVSTAIKTAEGIVATVKTIFLNRMMTPSFLIDGFSALPLELFSSIILSKVSDQGHALLYLNRILKIWRIKLMFQKFENHTNADVLFIRYFKCCLMLSYIIYFSSCVLYSLNCFDFVCVSELVDNNSSVHLLWCALVAAQILSGIGLRSRLSKVSLYYPGYLLLSVLSTCFYMLMYGGLAAEHALKRMTTIKLGEILTDVVAIIETNKLSNKYQKRICRFVKTQWLNDNANYFIFNQSPFAEMSAVIHDRLQDAMYRNTLICETLFEDLSEEMVFDICAKARSLALPPNEVICYTGEICNTMYIIEKGNCKIVSDVAAKKQTVLGERQSICVVEACLRVPVVNTIVTITHCRLLSVNFKDVKDVFLKYPAHTGGINKVLTETDLASQLTFLSQSSTFDTEFAVSTEKRKAKSFRKFGYNLKVDSFKEYDYYIPFDRLNVFSFLQYFLLRFTILPNGNFFYMWEIGRCICAVASALFFPVNRIGTSSDGWWYYLLIALDAMAWIDIYLRLHVCYYNRNGILVSHPLKTAIYYIKHSFIIDLIGVFPVHFFFAANNRERNGSLSIFQLNRVLQMYRYLGFFNYIDKNNLFPSTTLGFVKYFPLSLVLFVCTGSTIINFMCRFGSKIKNPPGSVFEDGVTCRSNTWITHSDFIKPLNEERVQAYAVYFAASVFTISGMMGFSLQDNINAFIGIIMAIVAYMHIGYVIAKSFARHTSDNSTLLLYQHSIKSIRQFMNNYMVHHTLQHDLIAHYELKWQRKRGRDIHESVCKFNPPLQQDILYDIYGRTLEETSVFITDSKVFLRSLLLEVSHDVILRNSLITCINDISKYIYILYKGSANAIAADGSILATLVPGSMFGNLDDCIMSRQTISVVALENVEILTIETISFYKVLSNYPRLQRRFKYLTSLHVDYLEGRVYGAKRDERTRSTRSALVSRSPSKIPFPIFNKVFDHESLFIRIWQFIILVIVCNLELFFGLYQMPMLEYSLGSFIFQYVCDTLYIIHFYVQTHTTYKDESGVKVKDLKMIKQRFRRNRLLYYCTIISMIPLDIVVFFIPFHDEKLHGYLRLNRILRFLYVYYYFKQQYQKVDINLYTMRTLCILNWSLLMLHFFATLLIALSCSHSPSIHPPINCNMRSMDSYDKLKIYLTYFHAVSCIFTNCSQSSVYPQSWYLTVFFIFLMVTLRLTGVFFMSQIYSTLQMGYHRQNQYEQSLEKIKNYMKREDVSTSLYIRIQDYLKLLWKQQSGAAFPRLLAEAPRRLREDILNSAFAHHINHHFIFEKCHVDFNRQVVGFLTIRTYFADNYIISEGKINNCMYFIHQGIAEAVVEDSSFKETIVGTLCAGMSFGVAQGLTEAKPHTYSFRALKETVILQLNYGMWKHLLKFFPASAHSISERTELYEETFL